MMRGLILAREFFAQPQLPYGNEPPTVYYRNTILVSTDSTTH
jgi:hypothetical protein